MRIKPFLCLISSICFPGKSVAKKFYLFFKKNTFVTVTQMIQSVFRYVVNKKQSFLMVSSLIIFEVINIEVGIPVVFVQLVYLNLDYGAVFLWALSTRPLLPSKSQYNTKHVKLNLYNNQHLNQLLFCFLYSLFSHQWSCHELWQPRKIWCG